MTERLHNWLDSFGAVASWTCAAHCLFTPLLMGITPLVGLSFLFSETTERVLIGISVSLAVTSLLPSYFRQHGKLHSMFLAVSGLTLIVMTHLLFEDNLILKSTFLITGAILISAAHLLNRYLCRTCKVC